MTANGRGIGGSSSRAIAAFADAWERPDAFRRVFSWVGRLYVATRMGIQACEQAGRVNCILPTPTARSPT